MSCYPVRSSQTRMPKAHQSALFPYPSLDPRMISGARYSGVPQRVKVRSLVSFFANPKSAIFTCPSLSMSRFSGLRSRQTIFFSCIQQMASNISQIQNIVTSLLNRPSFLRRLKSSPPEQNQKIIQIKVSSWKADLREQMKGWFSSLRMRFQSLMCSTCFRLIMWDFEICFRASTSFEGLRTSFTRPKVPAPRVSVIQYLEMSVGQRFCMPVRLDLEGLRSGSVLRGGPTSSLYRSFCSFSSLFSSRLNCSVFIFKNYLLLQARQQNQYQQSAAGP